MKILDATTIIAFLNEMNYPDGLVKLSKHYEIVIPEGVVNEIKKEPSKVMLQNLIKRQIVRIVKVDQSHLSQLLKMYPQLRQGECEAIVFMQAYSGSKKTCIVSDDLKAKTIFKQLNFKGTSRWNCTFS